ncbi:hypothetical protein [Caballeronia zhejiangensis]|uniref:hypothetical protein n=1 Tax=Caballeronia zhejiangensis TaxID=871203 RepID=UPI00158DF72A|nr:hypothetical protein [Caballeronia zhejiangensis]
MSKKHEQRTRAEILAKRTERDYAVAHGVLKVQKVESRSKYTPHFGAKQAAKLQHTALKVAA